MKRDTLLTIEQNKMAFELVVIGTSQGGLQALSVVLSGLPGDFTAAVAVVQHQKEGAEGLLCEILQRSCVLPVNTPEDKEEIRTGHVYVAPPVYHLLVDGRHFALSMEAPVDYARPSIDALFISAAYYYAEKTVGVILTGARKDGSQGLEAIKRRGGFCIVQDPDEAEAASMPEAAVAVVKEALILPINRIGPYLSRLCRPLS